MIDIDELERMANEVFGLGEWSRLNDFSIGSRTRYIGEGRDEAHAEYIAAACNSVPDLIAENRALQERVQKLEKENKQLLGIVGCMKNILQETIKC